MPYAPINFAAKFARFSEHWSPRIIAQMNDYHFKLAKIQGSLSGTLTPTPTRSSLSWTGK